MSWSIEEHIGDCRPFPAQVVVYRGETDECTAYVSGEVADRLKAENAKLRELVADMWSEGMCECGSRGKCARCEYDYPSRMAELGVGVDAPDYVPPFDPLARAAPLGEEVVRCEDCKHFKNDSRYGAWCGYFDSSLHDDYDGFCAWGERSGE